MNTCITRTFIRGVPTRGTGTGRGIGYVKCSRSTSTAVFTLRSKAEPRCSTADQLSARALTKRRFRNLLKCAINFSAHAGRFQYGFQYLLTYLLVRTKIYVGFPLQILPCTKYTG